MLFKELMLLNNHNDVILQPYWYLSEIWLMLVNNLH